MNYAENFPAQPADDSAPIFFRGYHLVKGICPACGAVDSHTHTNTGGSVIVFPHDDPRP